MNKLDDKSESQGCLKYLFWFVGGAFVFVSIIVIFSFLIEGKGYSDEFFDPDGGGVNLSLLRFTFIIAIIAFIIYLFKGGKARKIFDKD